jgi:hypothetical protein
LGFVVAGRRVEYYRQPVEDAVLMRLDLMGAEKPVSAWKDSLSG